MEQSTRVIMKMERNMGRDALLSQMVALTLVLLETMRFQASANIFGQTVKYTKDNGKETKCTGKVS